MAFGHTLSPVASSLRALHVPSGSLAFWLTGALLLAGCGGADHHAPAAGAAPAAERTGNEKAPEGASPSDGEPEQTVSITETASSDERGLLDVLAIGAMNQSLGSLDFTVRDRAGNVLSRGSNTVRGEDMDRRLLLDLPAGQGYELSLASADADEPSTRCHAEVGPFTVEPNATASYQAFLWQCDDRTAKPAPADECYWLADWVGSTRTRAAVGETIELSVSGKDASGTFAHVNWIEQAPQFGVVSDKHAAKTTFTCAAASDSIPVAVVITADACSRRLTLDIACD